MQNKQQYISTSMQLLSTTRTSDNNPLAMSVPRRPMHSTPN